MKNLFIILKATTAITLIVPITLSVTQYLGNYNKQDLSTNPDHIVTASQEFMNKQWLSEGTKTEKIDNFKHSYDKDHYPEGNKVIPADGHINNDDVNGDYYALGLKHKDGTNDGNGAPYVRFGGGLFLDGSKYSEKSKKDLSAKGLNNDLVSTSNFISTNPQKPSDVPGGLPNLANNKRNASDIKPESNLDPLDTSTPSWNASMEQYYQTKTSDFKKTKAQTDPNDKIINGGDLNYTPDYIPGTQKIDSTGDVTGKESPAKKMFTQLFNIELKDWYWKNWGQTYAHAGGNPTLANENIESATKRDDNLKDADLLKAPKLNLSASFNQLVSKTESDPWFDKMVGSGGAAAAGELFGKIFDKLATNIPFIGDMAGNLIDTFLPDSYTVYSTIQRLLPYQSVSLDEAVWDNFFNQYLGTPDNKYQGLIQKYYQTHKAYPADVNLNNFDIYSPFNSININSTFNYDYWKDYGSELDPDPKDDLDASDSNSTINLSNLSVDLAADIQFFDDDGPSKSELINELQNDTETWTLLKSGLNPKTSSASDPHNSGYLMQEFENTKYEPLTDHINFSGNIPTNGKVGQISWSYPGTAGGKINVEVL